MRNALDRSYRDRLLSSKYRTLKNWVNFWAILKFVEIFKTFLKIFREKLRQKKKIINREFPVTYLQGDIRNISVYAYRYGSIQTYLCAVKLCFSASNATLLFRTIIPPFTLTARSVRWGKESFRPRQHIYMTFNTSTMNKEFENKPYIKFVDSEQIRQFWW